MLAEEPVSSSESHDGTTYGDHDQPYSFGVRLKEASHGPFTLREFTRLTILRSQLLESDDPAARDLKPTARA